MIGMVSEQTADIEGENDGEFYVEKVIKMHVNKKGREEFLVEWVGYPLSETTLEPFENLERKHYESIKLFLFIQTQYLSTLLC